MTQLRIDFPDYPAEEQERDVKRSEQKKLTDVYMTKADDVWHAIIIKKHSIIISGKKDEDLMTFCMNIKEELQEMNIAPRFHYFNNRGIEEHLVQKQAILRKINEVYHL